MLVLAYILCPIFKLKYKSVRIYSRKYAYILRSVHDHVSGTVALFLLYEASIGRLGDFDHELVIVHEIFTCSWNDHHISEKPSW